MSPPQGPRADSQVGPWKSTNSVWNINTAKSLQKSRNHLVADKKIPQQGDTDSCLVKHIIFIDLLAKTVNGVRCAIVLT